MASTLAIPTVFNQQSYSIIVACYGDINNQKSVNTASKPEALFKDRFFPRMSDRQAYTEVNQHKITYIIRSLKPFNMARRYVFRREDERTDFQLVGDEMEI